MDTATHPNYLNLQIWKHSGFRIAVVVRHAAGKGKVIVRSGIVGLLR